MNWKSNTLLISLYTLLSGCCNMHPDLVKAHKMAIMDRYESCYTLNRPKELANKRYCLREVEGFKIDKFYQTITYSLIPDEIKKK